MNKLKRCRDLAEEDAHGANRKESTGNAERRKGAAAPMERNPGQRESKSIKANSRKAARNARAKEKARSEEGEREEPKQQEHRTQRTGLPECARNVRTCWGTKKSKENRLEQLKIGRRRRGESREKEGERTGRSVGNKGEEKQEERRRAAASAGIRILVEHYTALLDTGAIRSFLREPVCRKAG